MKPSEPRKVTGADGPTGPPAGRQGGTQPASDPSQDLQAARVEAACELMHDAYEAAAVSAGWETQQSSRKPWADVPEANKITMRAAVGALLVHLAAATDRADDAAGLVAGLMAEIQRLKRIGESHGDCRCDTNPETTGGPSEDCPQHGRPIDYWIERGDAVTEQRDVALAEVERLKKALRCGAEHPENETVVPCILDKGHAGQHVSSSGCAGSMFCWPTAAFAALTQRDAATAERDALAQAIHDGRGTLGFDNDGDAHPRISDYAQYAEFWRRAAEQEARDRDDALAEVERLGEGLAASEHMRDVQRIAKRDDLAARVLELAEQMDDTIGFRGVATALRALVTTEDRATIERVWDEGYRSGHSNAMRRMSDEPNAPTTPNPYRTTAPTEGGE